MNAQRRVTRIILSLAISGCAGIAAAAPHDQREHVNFRALSFAYGDVEAARGDLERLYPEGQVRASDVVADLRRAGATCRNAGAAASCSYDDRFYRDEYPLFATWTVQVDSRPDGALQKIDLTQTIRR